ncbi:hypothetical protein Pla123a_21360 [Posidoniimonas polymericola]|uniref:DUF1573 domain-containing protein n=1 Tax=Posidoniimonas polymericola TaxID=2528002 RepID=A0A5C5YRG3_9BACT|nr:DUF1573 domain-containing protein [Posidoniimonas polymericola]TWT77475.1 hypothetical protein Pla123a_21360 [Posidoniimonas polymericola]
MKAIHVVIVGGVLGAAIGSAVGYASVRPPVEVSLDPSGAIAGPGADTSLPRAVVTEPNYEFGVMQRGAKRRHQFRIRNEGTAALRLTPGRPSCKCTAFEVNVDLVPPGGEAEIGLEWVAKSLPGPFRQTAPLTTNDPLRPSIELSIEGTVIEPTALTPTSFVFGEIRAGEPATSSVIYYTTDNEPIELTAAAPDRDEAAGKFEVRLEPVDSSELEDPNAVAGQRIVLTTNGELPVGQIMEWVKIKPNREVAEGEVDELEVPVVGRVVGDITLHGGKWNDDAGVLNLGMVPSDEGASSRMLLSVKGAHAADTRFEVISTDPKELEVEIGETKRRRDDVYHTYLTVSIPKGTRPMIHLNTPQGDDGVIRLKTTHPNSPEVLVRVRFAVTK